MTIDGEVLAPVAGTRPLLSSREAGYSVAKKCLEVQADAEAAHPELRWPGGVRLSGDAVPWFVGAQSEIEVGEHLRQLGAEWTVFHSVPIGSGTTDVDHVLIGPAGIFAINTKNHRDAGFWVGDHCEKYANRTTHYAERSAREARDVAERLGRELRARVDVNPMVVLVGARKITDARTARRAVRFVPADDLVRWLRSLPPILEPQTLRRIISVADQAGTWHVDPNAADTFRVMRRFERLREDVQRGRSGAAPSHQRHAESPVAMPTPTRPGARRRPVLTAVLAVIALTVGVPAAMSVASLAASDPTALWVGVFAVLGALGLLLPANKASRRRRR